MAAEKTFCVTINLYKNGVFQLSHKIKNFIEASYTDKMHTGEKVCPCCYI